MNPEMLNRLRQGGFVRVTLPEGDAVTGWLGTDPEEPEFLRLDTLLKNESGYLEEATLRLTPDDVAHAQFLPEGPRFLDADGHDIPLQAGFFRKS
jgi:hypothetical protein